MRQGRFVNVKKAVLLLVVVLLAFTRSSYAVEPYSEELLSLIKLSPATATQARVTSLLGKPIRVEEGKKRVLWYYEHGNSSLVISWNKKSAQLEKFAFDHDLSEKGVFDVRTSQKLKTGVTNIMDAIKILGTPKDMTIKEMTQEMHYAYQNNVLRLFFRNKTLVDFTLY